MGRILVAIDTDTNDPKGMYELVLRIMARTGHSAWESTETWYTTREDGELVPLTTDVVDEACDRATPAPGDTSWLNLRAFYDGVMRKFKNVAKPGDASDGNALGEHLELVIDQVEGRDAILENLFRAITGSTYTHAHSIDFGALVKLAKELREGALAATTYFDCGIEGVRLAADRQRRRDKAYVDSLHALTPGLHGTDEHRIEQLATVRNGLHRLLGLADKTTAEELLLAVQTRHVELQKEKDAALLRRITFDMGIRSALQLAPEASDFDVTQRARQHVDLLDAISQVMKLERPLPLLAATWVSSFRTFLGELCKILNVDPELDFFAISRAVQRAADVGADAMLRQIMEVTRADTPVDALLLVADLWKGRLEANHYLHVLRYISLSTGTAELNDAKGTEWADRVLEDFKEFAVRREQPPLSDAIQCGLGALCEHIYGDTDAVPSPFGPSVLERATLLLGAMRDLVGNELLGQYADASALLEAADSAVINKLRKDLVAATARASVLEQEVPDAIKELCTVRDDLLAELCETQNKLSEHMDTVRDLTASRVKLEEELEKARQQRVDANYKSVQDRHHESQEVRDLRANARALVHEVNTALILLGHVPLETKDHDGLNGWMPGVLTVKARDMAQAYAKVIMLVSGLSTVIEDGPQRVEIDTSTEPQQG